MNHPMEPKNYRSKTGPVAQVSSPVQSFQVTRRNLPHFQEPGRVYFLTWRCRENQCWFPKTRLAMAALLHYDDGKWKVYAAVSSP